MNKKVYQFRGWISASMALVFFLGVTANRCSYWLLLLFPAILLRIWARQYIGSHSRGYEWDAPQLIVGGPYRFLHHPLYVSNALMGVSLAFYWGGIQILSILWSFIWIAWYGSLAFAENRFLQNRWGDAWRDWKGQAIPERTFWQALRADFWTWFWLVVILVSIEWMAK